MQAIWLKLISHRFCFHRNETQLLGWFFCSELTMMDSEQLEMKQMVLQLPQECRTNVYSICIYFNIYIQYTRVHTITFCAITFIIHIHVF